MHNSYKRMIDVAFAGLIMRIWTLCGYLGSLATTGVGDGKRCNVCFEKEPIDSHIITGKLLEAAFQGQECRTLLSVDMQRKLTTVITPATFVEKLECGGCDGSTSYLEGKFLRRLTCYKPSTPLHENDVLIFLVYGYRMLCMRNVLQYAVKDKLASYGELQSFMVQVWTIRRALQKGREIDFEGARNRVFFHVFTKADTDASTCSYRIELVLCSVDLTEVDPDLKCCPLIYTKALHCCWAVLLGDPQYHTAAHLQQFFLRMISRIDHQLSQEKVVQGIVRKNSLKIKL